MRGKLIASKKPTIVNLARALRSRSTNAENKLWLILRNGGLTGLKFRRQEPLGKYIVDFVCYEHKLIIEIDGGQHNESSWIERDIQRTLWLESQGFRVLRFWNNDVLLNLEGVYHRIQEEVHIISPSP